MTDTKTGVGDAPARRDRSTPLFRNGVRCSIRDGHGTRPIRWSEVADHDWSDFGLVLGAGGSTGLAFEAGILLALSVDHHIRLANASRLVGTSAGSVTSTLVTLGFEADDLAALVAEVPHLLSESAQAYAPSWADDEPPPMPHPLRVVRPPSPRAMRQTLNHLAHARFSSSILTSIRQGTFDLRERLAFLEEVKWPTGRPRMQLCVADVRRNERVVLDHTSKVSVRDAVAASCAVPAVMKPIRVGHATYVDGGLHSPTNADLLGGKDGPETVIVVSPMSGDRARTAMGWTSAMFSSRRLHRELRAFRPHQKVIVIEPVGRLSELVVDNALSPDNSLTILTSAFLAPSASRARRSAPAGATTSARTVD
jgi:NTE family protein